MPNPIYNTEEAVKARLAAISGQLDEEELMRIAITTGDSIYTVKRYINKLEVKKIPTGNKIAEAGEVILAKRREAVQAA
jgi:hypothetical protein